MPQTSISSLARKRDIFQNILANLRESSNDPFNKKQFERTWNPSKLPDMVGRTTQTVRRLEKEGRLPAPMLSKSGRRLGYSLDELNHMRDVFGTRPKRDPSDPPAIVAFANFKGGAGKSTLSTHFSQYCAMRGYRVLHVDVDPQASSTMMFGKNPDWTLDGAVTVGDFIEGEVNDFSAVIERPSYFPGIDLVSANLNLFSTEFTLARYLHEDLSLILRLRDGIYSVADNYDIIVLDPPPALGMLSMSAFIAANALVVPMRPTILDFASTAAFFSMVTSSLETWIKHGIDFHFNFESVLINGQEENKSAHREIVSALQAALPRQDIFSTTMKNSAEIDNANKMMKTVYDLNRGTTSSRATYDRCIKYFNAVNQDIENSIRRTWPSHIDGLRDEALA